MFANQADSINDRCQTWGSEREKAAKDILGSEGGENNRELIFY